MKEVTKDKILGSIRIQLITAFVICAILGFGVSRAVVPFFEKINETTSIDYSKGMENINWRAQFVADQVTSENNLDALQKMIEDEDETMQRRNTGLKVLVTDEAGKVLYKTKYAEEEHVDLHKKIRNVMNFAINQPVSNNSTQEYNTGVEFTTFYPIAVKNKNLYMFVSGIPDGEVIYKTNEGPFPIMIGILAFLLSFFYMTKNKMKQIEMIAQGVNEMAKGDLSYRIEQKGQDEIASLTENINHMAHKLMSNIEKEREAEKRKNELITNVSHDLRTPLTSIMGYLRLLRDKKFENNEQHDQYLKVVFSKSEQLKKLIEDLFEYSKLTERKIDLKRQEICINKLLEQLIEEVVPQVEERGLSIVKKFPEDSLYSVVDSELTVRLFDNLLMNAIKYSKAGGEIQVSLQKHQHCLNVCIANQTEELTKEELENLFDRFYKKDQSRSKAAEGSGLGLAIAKSIVELQGGEIKVEYENEVVQFITSLPILTENNLSVS